MESRPETGVRPTVGQPFDSVARYVPPAQASGAAASRPKPAVIFPETDSDDVVADHPPKKRVASSLLRPATYLASALIGAVLVVGLSRVAGGSGAPPNTTSPRSGSGADVTSQASAAATLDRRADSLALALSTFTIRASMYDSRRLPCSGLARGLTQVEDGWLAYNMARKDVLAVPDPGRDARDKRLYADVRAVEVRFERSSCARP